MNAELLRSLLHYDPDSGIFTWKNSCSKKAHSIIGSVAGTPHPNGYIRINIHQKMYYAHRLAWLYVYGEHPMAHIDHRDRNPANNKIKNLRVATRSQNLANRTKTRTNRSGFKGVVAHQGKWMARIHVNRKGIYLGVFSSPEKAHSAYISAANKMFGEFART